MRKTDLIGCLILLVSAMLLIGACFGAYVEFRAWWNLAFGHCSGVLVK